MQTKTKVIVFVSAIFVILILGLFAGWKFTAIGAVFASVVGSVFSRKPAGTNTDDVDKSARDAKSDAARAAEDMGRVSGGGEEIRSEGERLHSAGGQLQSTGGQLRDEGNNLVSAGSRLLDESKEG